MAPHVDEFELEPYADWLLERLPETIDLSSITKEWEAVLWFTVIVEEESPAVYFRPQTLARLAALPAALDVDLYAGNE